MDGAALKEWRKAERERLLDLRRGLSAEERAACDAALIANLENVLGDVRGKVVSLYWPIKKEPDLKPVMQRVTDLGGICALPIVEKYGQPLVFKSWAKGEPLERGVWNIPVPAKGEVVTPDIAFAPVVGFDRNCYRLGYGGGFFDRTLASLSPMPFVIGVGYAQAEIPTIHPQPFDIPMSVIVTETEVIK